MEQYLPRCLKSLLVADEGLRSRLEVLVVNDGSTDRTSEVGHSFAEKYPDVFRVIDKPNGNYGSCVNRGLAEAKGTFIKLLDADDWFDTAVFQDYLAFLQPLAEPSGAVDLVVNDFAMVDEADRVSKVWTYSHIVNRGFDKMFSPRSCALMHGVAYRTERVRAMHYRQTEGISYTDTEWIFVPMASVRAYAYFQGGVLYRYWIGREGQTVEPGVRMKNFRMYIPLSQTMLRFYHEHQGELAEMNRRYLETKMVLFVHEVYYVYMRHDDPALKNEDLLQLDDWIKTTCPELYACPENLSFPEKYMTTSRTRLRIFQCCVRSWRKHRRKAGFFIFIRALAWSIVFLRKLRGRARRKKVAV